MSKYNDLLEELSQQIVRKNRLHFILKDLEAQKKTLSDEVWKLERHKRETQEEADKLEKWSFAGFCYSVIGKRTEMLEKAKKEAYEAKKKYETTQSELQEVEAQIQRGNLEMKRLQRAEERYHQTLEEKAKAIKNAGGMEADEIARLEDEIVRLESRKKEVSEAISAGESARDSADKVLSSLDSAQSWGTWDLVGGGMVSGLAKHSHLDDAQRTVEILKIQVNRFKTELSDVTIHADMKVNADGFLRFADYFFDGLFADWMVLDKISQSQNQVAETKNQIVSVLNRLNGMKNTIEQELKSCKAQLDMAVSRVDI